MCVIPDLPLGRVIEAMSNNVVDETLPYMMMRQLLGDEAMVPGVMIQAWFLNNDEDDNVLAPWMSSNISFMEWQADNLANLIEELHPGFDRTVLTDALGLYPFNKTMDKNYQCFNGTWLLNKDLDVQASHSHYCMHCNTAFNEHELVEYPGWADTHCPNCHADEHANELIEPIDFYRSVIIGRGSICLFDADDVLKAMGLPYETWEETYDSYRAFIKMFDIKVVSVDTPRDLDAEFMGRISRVRYVTHC